MVGIPASATRSVLVAAVLGSITLFPASRASGQLQPGPDNPFGWRGDGSGRFPDATPVTEWSRTKNVVWKTPMPDWGHSQPVVVGEYVFTTAEPTTLLCLSRTDGKILWQKTHNLEDTLPASKRAQVRKDLMAAARIRKVKLDPLKRKLRQVTGKLQAMREDPFLRSQKGSLKRNIESLEKKLASLEEYRPPRVDLAIGHSNCTPVTDGQGLFALFGNGVGAVYDLAGRCRWIRTIRRAKMPFGHSMSPVLAARSLVMAIDKELLAVDATTGKELWRRPTSRPSGGLAAAKIGDVHVVVTAEGSVVRASDGKFLDRARQPARMSLSAPVIRGGVLYILGAGQQLMIDMLLSEGPGDVRLKNLASGRAFEGVYYTSPLYHDGCVFLWDKNSVLSVVDAATGRQIRSKRLGLTGSAYSSPALGGKYIFLGTDDGTMAVLEASVMRELDDRLSVEVKEVARNKLEPTRSSPVFAGKHMYLRTLENMYCIGGG